MSELVLTLPQMRRLKRPPARIVMTLIDIVGGGLWVLDSVLLIADGDIVDRVLGIFTGLASSLIVTVASLVLVLVYIPLWLDDRPLTPVTRKEWRDAIMYALLGAFLMADLLSR